MAISVTVCPIIHLLITWTQYFSSDQSTHLQSCSTHTLQLHTLPGERLFLVFFYDLRVQAFSYSLPVCVFLFCLVLIKDPEPCLLHFHDFDYFIFQLFFPSPRTLKNLLLDFVPIGFFLLCVLVQMRPADLKCYNQTVNHEDTWWGGNLIICTQICICLSHK